MKEKRTRLVSTILAVLALITAGLACGRRQAEPTAPPIIVVATATPGGAPQATTPPQATAPPQPTTPPQPTVPPAPTSTPIPGGCADGMQFVADVSVPEGTIFGPGEPFIKTWRIHNSGTCDWTGYRVVFADGEPMGTLDQPIADTPAGEELDISIEMTAPGGAGAYTGRWQVQSPGGAVLGTLTCAIVVQEEGGGEPPVEPTAEPTAEPTVETAGQPNLVIDDVQVWSPMPTAPETVNLLITVRNAGDGDAGAFTVVWYPYGSGEIGYSEDVPGLSPGVSVILDGSYTYAQYGEMHWAAVVDPEDEIAESDESNEYGGTTNVVAPEPESTTVTLQSLPAEDGYVRGVTTGESVALDGDVNVGDGSQNRAQQAFFSFDISGIPEGAIIESATLDLGNHTVRGDPFTTLGAFGVYFVQYGDLDTSDYVAGWPPGRATTLSGPPSVLNPASALQPLVDTRAPRFQIRLQFEGITDNDGQADGLTFPEGGPALTITYYMP